MLQNIGAKGILEWQMLECSEYRHKKTISYLDSWKLKIKIKKKNEENKYISKFRILDLE